MILTQHYLGCLSHASYLIGDETTGRAVVVDPRRDVGVYIDEAAANGLTIERVIETHVHADFVSGHLELADRLGAIVSYGVGADVSFAVVRRLTLAARRRRVKTGPRTADRRSKQRAKSSKEVVMDAPPPGSEHSPAGGRPWASTPLTSRA